MDQSFVGRSFPMAGTYLVGREKIRDFASAIGEGSALCLDLAAARAAGYADVVAPPTFAMAIVARAQEAIVFDPDLGLDFSRVVHGDQSFTHHRPIVAGDELGAVSVIDAIRVLAGNDILTVRTEIYDATHGPEALVSTASSTLVARAEAS